MPPMCPSEGSSLSFAVTSNNFLQWIADRFFFNEELAHDLYLQFDQTTMLKAKMRQLG